MKDNEPNNNNINNNNNIDFRGNKYKFKLNKINIIIKKIQNIKKRRYYYFYFFNF